MGQEKEEAEAARSAARQCASMQHGGNGHALAEHDAVIEDAADLVPVEESIATGNFTLTHHDLAVDIKGTHLEVLLGPDGGIGKNPSLG